MFQHGFSGQQDRLRAVLCFLLSAALMSACSQYAPIKAQEDDISQRIREYEQRPRKRVVGGKSVEPRFASYLNEWRDRVHAYVAGRQQTSAHIVAQAELQMVVTIGKEGDVVEVEMTRSSGNPEFDASAVDIIRRAAPYHPFSPEIARDTDLLAIVQTMTFIRYADGEVNDLKIK
jgi:protein TonB